MKNITTAIAAVTAGLLAITSCSDKTGEPGFDTVSYAEIISENNNKLDLDYRFEFISEFGDKEVLAKIQRSMTADFFGEDYLKETPEASAEAYRDSMIADFGQEVADFRNGFPDAYPWDWQQKIRSHTDIVNGRVLVYTVENSSYMGGAHGMETVSYSNYDLRTGDRLTLDDLFTPEGAVSLTDKIHGQILKDHGAADWEELMNSNCYWAKEEVGTTENFALSATHITFLYNPYDIACYAQGRTKVKLALDELDGFNAKAVR